MTGVRRRRCVYPRAHIGGVLCLSIRRPVRRVRPRAAGGQGRRATRTRGNAGDTRGGRRVHGVGEDGYRSNMAPSTTRDAPFGRMLTAMVTPFTADGAVDYDGAARLATY